MEQRGTTPLPVCVYVLLHNNSPDFTYQIRYVKHRDPNMCGYDSGFKRLTSSSRGQKVGKKVVSLPAYLVYKSGLLTLCITLLQRLRRAHVLSKTF